MVRIPIALYFIVNLIQPMARPANRKQVCVTGISSAVLEIHRN